MMELQEVTKVYDQGRRSVKAVRGVNLCVAGINGGAISINTLIANAITFLKANGNTTAAGTARNTATAYKNIFDGLNNGLVNVVPGTC